MLFRSPVPRYPMLPVSEGRVTWGEEHVGFAQVFAAAGFREVSRPGVRRAVMRLDFAPGERRE